MRILVGWDNAEQLETIESFLNIGDNSAAAFLEAGGFEAAMQAERFDAVLLALNFPSPTECFPLFKRVRETQPDTPVVGAWFSGEVSNLAKFMLAGLHSYMLRDTNEEFIMLLTTCLEAAHQSELARRSQLLAEKLREEVASVRQLQESVIPESLPQLKNYKLVARYEPSQIHVLGASSVVMAGGDYYDAFRLGEKHLVLMLGDAAGHGVRACMSIMTMHTLITMTRNQVNPDTSEFVGDVNRRICKSSIVAGVDGGFITLLYGSLDLERNMLQWTSAGHPLPLLHRLDTNEIAPIGSPEQAGLPLAVADSWVYPASDVLIPPRSRLLLYSDGLEEAFPNDDRRHEQFGVQGITETMQAMVDAPLEAVLEELFAASHRATHGAGRLDDTSIMLLERTA